MPDLDNGPCFLGQSTDLGLGIFDQSEEYLGQVNGGNLL
jgi:hypothetical protein